MDTAPPTPSGLRRLIDEGADSRPDAVAVGDRDRTLTWRSLRERSSRVASALVRDGVGPQRRVCFIGKNCLDYFSLLFGCALANTVFVPLNWRLGADELVAHLEDCAAAVVFTDALTAGTLDEAGWRHPVVSLGAGGPTPTLDAWLGPAVDPARLPAADDIAFQMYTSGTTGRPKGAMFTSGANVRVLLEDVSVQWGFRSGDVSLVCMPMFHMGGLAWALAGLARGARAEIVGDFDPAAVLDTIQRAGVTMAFCVPTMLKALIAVPGVTALTRSLRSMCYSGAPISAEALTAAQEALQCDFFQIYGLTEATGAFAQLSAEEHRAAHARPELLVAAGRPYPWVEVEAVDGETGRSVPTGELGEIWTRSEQNMVGYWNQPEETSAALTPDGWLRTGDIGRLDHEGRIHLVDRAKDLIISGGENVYPAEVEGVLESHPDVAEVAVIGVPDERWGETVKAMVVAHRGVVLDPAALIAFARKSLAAFKCPTSVEIVGTLPRTATGKIRKVELREPYWQQHARRIH